MTRYPLPLRVFGLSLVLVGLFRHSLVATTTGFGFLGFAVVMAFVWLMGATRGDIP